MPFKSPGLVLALTAALVVLVLAAGSVSAAGDSADQALATALDYVEANADDLGVTSADVDGLILGNQATTADSGVTTVHLIQSYKGLPVLTGSVTVSLDAQGRVFFASGSLVSLAGASGVAELDAAEAVEAAADGLDLDAPSDLEVSSGGGKTVVSGGGISDTPIPAKLGWQPTADGLRLAWQLEIDDSSSISLWNAAVDAETGELLNVEDLTIEDEHEDLAATLTGGNPPAPTPVTPARGFSLNPVVDGSCYRVYDLALESPNDGPRRLVCNPADSLASPWGWHDTDGAPGPEFTITRGNNAHAYFDQEAAANVPNGNQPDVGHDVDGGPGLQFDFPADLNEHPQNYREAVATNLFFNCNTFHNLLYIRGWTEQFGNFQANNYGRGGVQGDYVRCEAADGNGTNNANMSTPSADGGTPRMQMFLWPGSANQNQIVVGASTFNAGWSRFGSAPTVAGTTGALFNAGNGCAPADYAGNPGGTWIALAIGGNAGCPDIDKARQAGAAGASGIVIYAGTSNAILTGSMAAAVPNIPVASTTAANGNAIIALLPANGTLRKHPNHPGIRDGSFENGIIFHEYGHGMSNRLTGPLGMGCLGGNEQAGEGWSDYVANVSMIDPDLESPEGPRGMGPYALFQPNRQGNGIRPRPYSRTFTIQPTTYDSIKTNGWLINAAGTAGTTLAAPHGVGHAWASILWHATWDLIDKHGFYPNIYDNWDKGGNNRAMQYMVDGLKAQGCNPNFVISRAAIIASANARAGGAPGQLEGDSCTLWGSFSIRGLGFSANGGGTSRDDGTEAFDTHPGCRDDFASPSLLAYGQLNQADPGKVVKFKVDLGANLGENQLAAPQYPFSRRVDCSTLAVPSQGPIALTPREYPIKALSSDGLELKFKQNEGVYQFNWQTLDSWLGTCREFVLQVKDGTQFRAFFQFLYPFEGFSGTVKGPVTDVSSKNVFTLWWKLGGDRGLDIFSSPPQSRQVDCTTFAPLGAYTPTQTTTGLGYQASTARYFYPWVPDPSWLGTCREFTISLNDGTSHSTFVRYVK